MATINTPSTSFKLVSLASTNSNLIRAGSTILKGFSIGNTNAAVRYVKFYNKATAPTVGTDTPLLTFQLLANSIHTYNIPDGVIFSLGLGIGLTTGITDGDTGAVSANETIANVFYKSNVQSF